MSEQKPVFMYVYGIYDSFSNLPEEVFASAVEPGSIGAIMDKENLNHPRPNCNTEDIRLLLQVDVLQPDCMSMFPVVGDFQQSFKKLEERSKEFHARREQGNN